MTARTLVNGHAVATVDAGDRGFTLGDGLFETIPIIDGQPLHWATHWQRLGVGCTRLGLPEPDADAALREARQAIDGDPHGVLRITVTRGPAPPGYALPDPASPTRVVRFTPISQGLPARSRPISVRTCSLRLGVQPALAGIKHLNRLEQILARAEWSDATIAEGLMYDSDGFLVEATASNVFLVSGGALRTPRLDRNGVAGVCRSCVLAAAANLGLSCHRERLHKTDVDAADEVFLANSVHGIRAVRALDDRRLDAPGRLTERLIQAMDDLGQVTYRAE